MPRCRGSGMMANPGPSYGSSLLFTISGDGRDQPVRLWPGQMHESTLGKIFGFYPKSIILIGDDGTVATPTESGEFIVEGDEALDNLVRWVCMGDVCRVGPNKTTYKRCATLLQYTNPSLTDLPK